MEPTHGRDADLPEDPRNRIGVGVDARRLWAGGVASAVVAGLVALVGVLVSRWLFKLPVMRRRDDGPESLGGNVVRRRLATIRHRGWPPE